MHPDQDELETIRYGVVEQVAAADRDNVETLIIEEIRHPHEGVLARYGLRPSEYARWQARRL